MAHRTYSLTGGVSGILKLRQAVQRSARLVNTEKVARGLISLAWGLRSHGGIVHFGGQVVKREKRREPQKTEQLEGGSPASSTSDMNVMAVGSVTFFSFIDVGRKRHGATGWRLSHHSARTKPFSHAAVVYGY